MDTLNNMSIFEEDNIDLQEVDVIKYVIDKYKSAEGSKDIDAFLYSIYMGN